MSKRELEELVVTIRQFVSRARKQNDAFEYYRLCEELKLAQAALAAFSSGTGTLSPVAYQLQGYKYNRALMLPTVTRVTQAIVGEISVDEAVDKIATDMAEAVKQAEK